ncbi:MAG TPA: FMN-binding protein [Planctomycetota bacterium]|nr:FMN-binding protein [Planctomycetota bacterium]
MIRMRSFAATAVAASLFLAAAAGAARADVVYLKSGLKYEGAAEEQPDGSVIVKLERGSLSFTKEQVDRVEKGPPPWEVYEEKAKALLPEDVSGRMDLARWCKAHNLPMRMKQELERVIVADPDNAEARGLLGHRKVKDKWQVPDDGGTGKAPPKDPPVGTGGPKPPVGGPAAPGSPPDGTYRGKSRGCIDDVEVEVVVVLGRIAEVKILDQKESRPRTALADMPARIMEKQSASADAVSGATMTSNAIKRATASALASARPVAVGALPDGTYTDRSRGARGDVTVQVAIKGGQIVDVGVTSHSESADGASGEALKTLPGRIKAAQSAQVDPVAGAEVVSMAIIRAAQSALEKAAATAAAKPAK